MDSAEPQDVRLALAKDGPVPLPFVGKPSFHNSADVLAVDAIQSPLLPRPGDFQPD
jgi:hypothetical protein